MRYSIRLTLAKILISFAVLAQAGLAVMTVRAYHEKGFLAVLDGMEIYHNLTMAVMLCAVSLPLLYLIWSGLHGTGRSVRMAAFVSFCLLAAPFIALQMSVKARNSETLHDSYYVVGDMGMIQPLLIAGALILGLILSIRSKA